MQKQGFIFIPDISGFTDFVNTVELQHSRHVIKELLEIIIGANQMKLKISEVEGDAILFYQFGEVPSLETIYAQVEKIFLAFHQHILIYERQRTCYCDACISVINLSLKFISHYGEFTEYEIGDFSKLIGKDIITAHQLLKNDIPDHEYWLISTAISEGTPKVLNRWMQWTHGRKEVNQRDIFFHFTKLASLKSTQYSY